MLLLCNHQVDIESVLFNFLASPLIGSDVNVIARIEHRQSWIGRLIDILKSYPGMREREFVAYLDRANPHAMFDLLADYRRGLTTEPYSLMVHVQGELGFTCREPVNKLASTLISLAIEFDFPIVPVRFVGGLPVEPLPKSIAFPIGFGRQDYVIGKPLSLQHLASLPNRQRKSTVLDAINSIEPLANDEEPLPPQQEFAELVNRRALEGFDTVSAAMIETILSDEHPGQELAFVRDYFAEKAGARSLDGYPEWERRFLSWLCGNE
jgi:1-acyl-sn-glycerol-3-phosphate acyltransferase